MTLEKRVAMANDDELIFVGSKSGYLYIGYKKDFDKEIDIVSKNCLKELVKFCNKAEKELKYISNNPPAEGSKRKISVYENGKRVTVVKEYKDLLKEWEQTVKEKEKRYNCLKKQNETFTPLRERTVKAVCKKEVDNAIAIIIKGYENGKYWTLDEWNKDHERK